MKLDQHSGLVVAALVALVAVVGLVIPLNNGGTTGASVCGPNAHLQQLSGDGLGPGYYQCVPLLSDVKTVPQGDGVWKGNTGSKFQNDDERKERTRQIVTGEWEY